MSIYFFTFSGEKILRIFSVFFLCFLGYMVSFLFFAEDSVFAEEDKETALPSEILKNHLPENISKKNNPIDPYAKLILKMDDLYINTYKNLSSVDPDKIQEKTLKQMSKKFSNAESGIKISPEDIQEVLNGNLTNRKNCFKDLKNTPNVSPSEVCISPLVRKYCTGNNPNNFSGYIACQKKLRETYTQQLQYNAFAKEMETYTRAHQAFTNGTLKDTGNQKFDIIIDLNILDVLLFGDKFTAPHNASPFFPHKTIAQTLQDIEDNNSENSNNSGNNTSETSGNSGETNNTENQENSENNTNSGANNSSENSENNTNTSENSHSGNINTSEFCIDPEVLIFSDSNTSENNSSENSGNTENTPENSSENSDNQANENPEISLSNEEMQNGNYFSGPEYEQGGDEYPDVDAIEELERERGFRKDCSENERPLFGGRMCVPSFCTEIFCVRVVIKEGHKQTNLRPLDCVECHIDKGNEALTPLMSTLGQNTPHTNPMEPNFMGAFAAFGHGFSGIKVYTQPKKLPFLVYDQGDSLTDQRKEKAKAEENSENSGNQSEKKNKESDKKNDEKSDEERLKKLITKNTELFQLITLNCNVTGNYGDNLSNKKEVCIKDKQERQEKYDKKYASEYNIEAVKNASKSESYKRVVEPFFYGFSEDMRQINFELQKIDEEAIKKAKQQCKK